MSTLSSSGNWASLTDLDDEKIIDKKPCNLECKVKNKLWWGKKKIGRCVAEAVQYALDFEWTGTSKKVESSEEIIRYSYRIKNAAQNTQEPPSTHATKIASVIWPNIEIYETNITLQPSQFPGMIDILLPSSCQEAIVEKLDLCHILLVSRPKNSQRIYKISPNNIEDIWSTWMLYSPVVHVWKDVISWTEIHAESTTSEVHTSNNPSTHFYNTLSTHFIDVRTKKHTTLPGIWEHYGVVRTGWNNCLLIIRATHTDGMTATLNIKESPLRKLYDWSGDLLQEVENFSFSQSLSLEFEEVHIMDNKMVECIIGMRLTNAGTFIFEGVSSIWIIYSLQKKGNTWLGKRKTPIWQEVFDF